MKAKPLKKIAILSLGSNLGDRFLNIKKALSLIDSESIQILAVSNTYESESWGYSDKPYLNLCLTIETNLAPKYLLNKFLAIEKSMGRDRKIKVPKNEHPIYTGRTIDIDILFYDQEIITLPELIIPHPKLHLRLFVLKPLKEIASNFIHPVYKEDILTIYKRCEDKSLVELFKP